MNKKLLEILDLAIIIINSICLSVVICFSVISSWNYIWIGLMLFVIFGVVLYKVKTTYQLTARGFLQITYKMPENKDKISSVILFLSILGTQVLYWLAYFPGGFNLDAYGQWDQAHGYLQYDNWHPIFTTIIYKLIITVADSFSFCVFIQLCLFSVVLTWILKKIYYIGVPFFIIEMVALLIGLNPAVSLNNICLIKDAYFVIFYMLLFGMTIDIYTLDGERLSNPLFFSSLVLISLFLLMIRHNSLFVIIPFWIVLGFCYRKGWSGLFFVIGSFLIIQLIVLPMCNVRQHDNVVGESVGIPMALMANAYVNEYDNTPKEVINMLDEIAPITQWEQCYITGEWDSCKWELGNGDLFRDESLLYILKLAWKTLISCPQSAYSSIRENTRVTWQIVGLQEWSTYVYIEPNDYNIDYHYFPFFNEICNYINVFSNSLFGSVFSWNGGLTGILLVLLSFYICCTKEYKQLLFLLPLYSYNFLTTLLLCGPNQRYFYFNTIIILPLICLFLFSFAKHDLRYRKKTL